ncbi:MAG: hypothetical protein C4523_00725 [Myxococcales bacterium]|nr:MAG: hypothetical protein C4523_00725 [Myxococcales bacterium]
MNIGMLNHFESGCIHKAAARHTGSSVSALQGLGIIVEVNFHTVNGMAIIVLAVIKGFRRVGNHYVTVLFPVYRNGQTYIVNSGAVLVVRPNWRIENSNERTQAKSFHLIQPPSMSRRIEIVDEPYFQTIDNYPLVGALQRNFVTAAICQISFIQEEAYLIIAICQIAQNGQSGLSCPEALSKFSFIASPEQNGRRQGKSN